MAVRIEKILCVVLDEAHKRQVEETTDTLSEGPEPLLLGPRPLISKGFTLTYITNGRQMPGPTAQIRRHKPELLCRLGIL
jgi:hypothetical protein